MKNLLLDNIKPTNVFKVPNGYFEALGNQIENEIFNEGLNSKLPFESMNFEVPTNYFDTLSDRILTKISNPTSISLEEIPNTNIFKVPTDYFDTLETQARFIQFQKENVFKVQNNYFEILHDKILANVFEKNETKILKVNWWQNTKLMWSAAASIILVVGFLWAFLPSMIQSETESALNKLTEHEISSYLETQDLSMIEAEVVSKADVQNSDNQVLEHLNIETNDILQHLETEDLEEI